MVLAAGRIANTENMILRMSSVVKTQLIADAMSCDADPAVRLTECVKRQVHKLPPVSDDVNHYYDYESVETVTKDAGKSSDAQPVTRLTSGAAVRLAEILICHQLITLKLTQ